MQISKEFNADLLFVNEYEFICKILKIKKKELSEEEKEHLYANYFTKEKYLKLVKYIFIENKEFPVIDFVLPNKNNLKYLESSISLKLDFNNIFDTFKIKESSEIKTNLIDYYFNLLAEISNNKLNDTRYFEIILNFLKQKSSDVEFRENDIYKKLSGYINFYLLFKNLSSLLGRDEKSFSHFTRMQLMAIFSKSYMNKFVKIKYDFFTNYIAKLYNAIKDINFLLRKIDLKIILLQIFFEEKMPIKNLSFYIKMILEDSPKDKEIITKLLLKFLIENFADNVQNNMIILEALEMNENILDIKELYESLTKVVKMLNVFSTKNIVFSLKDIFKAELLLSSNKIEFESSEIYEKSQMYLIKIMNDLKLTSDLKFIDSNIKGITALDDYLAKFNKSFLRDFFSDLFKDKETHILRNILKIIKVNEYLSTGNNFKIIDFNSLLSKFLSVRTKLKSKEVPQYMEDIEEFIKLSLVDSQTTYKLKNVLRIVQIKKVCEENQISSEFLNEFDYDNLNLSSVLEIFLINKFNLEKVDDLQNLVSRTEDIKKALQLNNNLNDYLFILFEIFFKYQREEIYLAIMDKFVDSDVKNFEKCVKMMKKAKIETKYRTKIIENCEDINLILEETKDVFEKFNSKDLIPKKFNPDETDYVSKLSQIKFESFETSNKEKFIKLLEHSQKLFKSENREQKNIIMKYSLNPIMKSALEELKIDYLGKEFKINTNVVFKSKIYRTLIRSEKISISQIIGLEVQNYNKDKNKDIQFVNYEDVNQTATLSFINLLKIICPLITYEILEKRSEDYKKLLLEIKDIYNPTTETSKSDSLSNHIMKEILIFLLTNFNTVTYSQFAFISKSLNLEVYNDDGLFTMLEKITRGKFNFLPFLRNEKFIELNNTAQTSSQLNSIYNDYLISVNYFYFTSKEKTSTSSKLSEDVKVIQKRFQMIEVYKNLNMNNFSNFRKIFNLLNKQNSISLEVDMIFYIKLINQLSNISSSFPTFLESVKTVLLLIQKYEITNDSLKYLVLEVFNLPAVSFVIESHKGLVIFDQKISITLKNLITAKLVIFQEIFSVPQFKNFLSKNYLLLDKFKILKVKNHLLGSMKGSELEIRQLYESLKLSEDFNQIKALSIKNLALQRELEKIYTESL